MFYYLAQLWVDDISALNVLTYHTVRAGGAAVTGFVLCLLLGPRIIRWLRALKIGQYIKEDHVADLHALHKGKAGTPTMGGTIIIFSTLLSLFLWCTWTNRLLLVTVGVLCLLGAVGFLDDYLKLRRKHNDGLSARAKLIGQVGTGLILGVYLYFNPITVGASYIASRDVIDWNGLAHTLARPELPAGQAIKDALPLSQQQALERAAANGYVSRHERRELLDNLNRLMETRFLYDPATAEGLELNGEFHALEAKDPNDLSPRVRTRLNRLLLEAVCADSLAPSERNLHTKVGIPGLKNVHVPLGIFYIILVVLIITGTSNAVNLTDGLDGLAAGASVISLLAYTAIAYIASRADWSQYLYLVYVPEASELTVLGATLIGTGLGFLWFNSHPAEVFMGDTGSLALGGVIGTMAILTKQELLLPMVAGLFVLEAMSVVIQVASFKLTGRRVFRMAPLHHHFELKGWSETKVTIRFWIIAIIFVLMSLATLKLR